MLSLFFNNYKFNVHIVDCQSARNFILNNVLFSGFRMSLLNDAFCFLLMGGCFLNNKENSIYQNPGAEMEILTIFHVANLNSH